MIARDRAAFEAAKKRGFLLLPPRAKKLDLRNAWWRYCTQRRMPYLTVRPTGKYARLNLDLLPADLEFVEAAEDPYWKDLWLRHVICGGSELRFLGDGLDFVKVRSETCEELADAVLEHVAREGVTRPQPTVEELSRMAAFGV